ncbi:hypothetical protein BH24DEI2_BH24DEI2_07560 [soil metagenome]
MVQGLPKTPQGRASLALRMMAQAQYDSTLLDTKVFALLFEGVDGAKVLMGVNKRLCHDPALARVALSASVSPHLDASTLSAAKRAQTEDDQPSLFPWLAAARTAKLVGTTHPYADAGRRKSGRERN